MRKYLLLPGFLLFSGFFFLQPAGLGQKIKITTSVFPLLEFAKAVAGERGEVHLLLPPGAGVHTWQPRASDITRLASADLFIYIGAGLEPWIGGVLRSLSSRSLRTLAVGESLPLKKDEANNTPEEDPHVWLDFALDGMIVDWITESLSQIDPAQASFFQNNAAIYKKKLAELDEKFSTGLKSCRHRSFLLGGHAAFGYLARRYGLEQISLYGLSPDAAPAPSRMMSLIEWAKANSIKTVYVEANASSKMAKILAKETGGELLALNPGANLTKRQLMEGLTFFEIMEENLKSLKKGLLCD